MYEADHPESEHLGERTIALLTWINVKETEGKLSIQDTRELIHLITEATEETLINVIGEQYGRPE